MEKRLIRAEMAVGAVALLMIAFFPAPVHAERLVWMSSVPTATDQALHSSLEHELQVELVPLAQAWERVERLASRYRGRVSQRRANHAERRALDAYLHLRLSDAAMAFDRALEAALAPSAVPPSSEDIGRLLFGRGLVHLAAAHEDEALHDLRLAQKLRPRFRPDPREYGPPIFRALTRARQMDRSARHTRVDVDRVPQDASVTVDGTPVRVGRPLRLSVGQPHLLIASRTGYAPIVRWIEATREETAREVVVLSPLDGAALGAQILALRDAEETGLATPSPALRDVLVQAIDATGSIEARTEETAIRLIYRNAEGSVQREAVGSSVSWEPEPYATLAASLAGRVLEPPAPSTVALTVSAPSRVDLGDDIAIQTRLVDREGRVEAVVARCDDLRTQELAADAVSLVLVAPEEPGDLRCDVRAVDSESRILARSPETFGVTVENPGPVPWYARWYIWGTIALVVGVGVGAAVLVTQQEPPENVLVIGVP